MSSETNVQWDKCPVGQMSIGKMSSGTNAIGTNVQWDECHWENVQWDKGHATTLKSIWLKNKYVRWNLVLFICPMGQPRNHLWAFAPPFYTLFQTWFVLSNMDCPVSWIPRIPVFWSPGHDADSLKWSHNSHITPERSFDRELEIRIV